MIRPLAHHAALRLAVLGAGIACASQALAFVDCCLVHVGPTYLHGFALQVASTDEADDWAERFGFWSPPPADKRGEGARTLPLPRGVLAWRSTVTSPVLGLDTGIGMPMSSAVAYCGSRRPPEGEPDANDGAVSAPNGARAPLRAIAVVTDVERVLAEFKDSLHGRWTRAPVVDRFDLPDLGARAYDARFDMGAYRFLVPTDSTGIAARWLAAGPPRWIGIAFEVEDVVATERALAARNVRVVTLRDGPDALVRVMPEITGGPLLEFVESGRRR